MLGTRLWMGTVLVGLAVGVLVLDQFLAPWYPFLFLLIAGLSLPAGLELRQLLDDRHRPDVWLCCTGLAAAVIANWLPHLPGLNDWQPSPWPWIVGTLTAILLSLFLVEMSRFQTAGNAVHRLAATTWIIGYLGLLPCFLAQLRWLDEGRPGKGTAALALAIFVPKVCDIGAYFVGRFLGRHPMAPRLSPKKTWEGAAGGLAFAVLTAVVLDRILPGSCLGENLAVESVFGLTVGAISMLGDLAESLIKRDCGRKDASHILPGFGGILDVVDSVIFPAPVVYLWLNLV
jgi:phosphatidate cytidylyltransferase